MRAKLISLFWLAALVVLYYASPTRNHFSVCLFSHLGFENCWGCGLGRGMHLALRGDWSSSLTQHWFSIPAIFILFIQIVKPFIPSKLTPSWINKI